MVETLAALGDEPDLTLAAISPASDSELLIIPGYLGENDYPVNILIDGGAHGNYISEEIAQAAQITLDSGHPRTLTVADGRNYRGHLAPDVTLNVHSYHDKVDFISAPIVHHAILGKPWLEAYNPEIDWTRNSVSFQDKDGTPGTSDPRTPKEEEA